MKTRVALADALDNGATSKVVLPQPLVVGFPANDSVACGIKTLIMSSTSKFAFSENWKATDVAANV